VFNYLDSLVLGVLFDKITRVIGAGIIYNKDARNLGPDEL
jgi:hypothetical protein